MPVNPRRTRRRWDVIAIALAVAAARLLVSRSVRADDAKQQANTPDSIEQSAELSRLRHDIRGALSPALLLADRLSGSSDPQVKRAGDIICHSIDKAVALLKEMRELSHKA